MVVFENISYLAGLTDLVRAHAAYHVGLQLMHHLTVTDCNACTNFHLPGSLYYIKKHY